MFTTSFMGLLAWDQGLDAYDHAQLANNFIAIDAHDHTTGRGRQIPSAGIQDGAITGAKIAANAVTPDKIPDGSLTQQELAVGSVGAPQIIDGSVATAEIANGAVTFAKLDPSVIPIGTVIMWYRPNGTVAIPSGWEILDGRTWVSVPNAWGIAAGSIPDFRNRFPLGAALSGTGSNSTDPPDIGQIGGAMSVSLAHTHVVAGHTHTIPDHTHPIGSDGDHRHLFPTTVWDGNGNPVSFTATHLHQRSTAVPSAAGSRQSLYVPDNNRNDYYGTDVEVQMSLAGAHSHGGGTAGSGAFPTTSATSTTDSQLGTAVTRPQFVGLLFLIRVN